jgi:class 3 adenylate cyclase
MKRIRDTIFTTLDGWHSLKRGLLTAVIIGVAFSVFEASAPGDKVESYVAHRINFILREKLHLQPLVDPRIKIFAIDDLTAAYLKSQELPFQRWQRVLQAIGKRKPTAIFIDKIFGMAQTDAVDEAPVKELTENIPIYVGGFSTPEPIAGRREYPYQEDPRNNLTAFLPDGPPTFDIEKLPWMEIKTLHFYGPGRNYLDAFAGVGLLDYALEGHIRPIRRPDANHLVPHIGLRSSEVKLSDEGLVVNGQKVAFDSRGRVLVNLLPVSDVYKKTFRLKTLLTQVEQNRPISQVDPGDLVIILPLMYTGNSDQFETPAGMMPGGFVVMSVINSTLNGKWLKTLEFAPVFILTITILTALAANFLTWVLAFVTSIIIIPSLVFASGILLFSSGGYVVPWLSVSVAGTLTGLFIFYEKSKSAQIRTRELKLALGRAVPPAMLEEIIRNPESLLMRPTTDTVSIMFIDIAGFSLISERQDAREVFSGLKEFNEFARRLVHEYGGVVDKALGDGVLSYFGHSFHKPRALEAEVRNHAELALQCAIRIQQENILHCLENVRLGKAIYPLRIGINTSSVYIGNLGDETRMEFTIVGHGVNYAKRLEEGCEIFKILIGADSKSLVSATTENFQKLEPRLLQIKHHEDTQREAYEFDPFINDEAALTEALNAYQKSSGFVRQGKRWEVANGISLDVKFPVGSGRLTSYSEDGFSMESGLFFARGVDLTLALSDETSTFYQLTNKERLFPIIVDVRWGRKIGTGRFAHGLRIKSLNRAQKEVLMKIFFEIHQRAHSAS